MCVSDEILKNFFLRKKFFGEFALSAAKEAKEAKKREVKRRRRKDKKMMTKEMKICCTQFTNKE